MVTDPATAAYAWSRYRRLMRWLMAATIALMLVALRLAFQHAGSASIRRYVVAALGFGVAMLLSSALMGCLYLARHRRRRERRRGDAGGNPPPERRRPDVPG